MHALTEEQKQRHIEELKGDETWQRIKDRVQKEHSRPLTDDEILMNYKPRENEFTKLRRLHQNTNAKREKIKPDNPYSRGDFENWRRHQESVYYSIKATMSERREKSALFLNGEIPPMSSFTPSLFVKRDPSPIFQFHTKPKFERKRGISETRNISDTSRDTPAPWISESDGTEQLEEDTITRWANQGVDILQNDTFDQEAVNNHVESNDVDAEFDRWTANKEYDLKKRNKGNLTRSVNKNITKKESCYRHDNYLTNEKDMYALEEKKSHESSGTDHTRQIWHESLNSNNDLNLNDCTRRCEIDCTNSKEKKTCIKDVGENQPKSFTRKAKDFFVTSFGSSKDSTYTHSTTKSLNEDNDNKNHVRPKTEKRAEDLFISLDDEDIHDHDQNVMDKFSKRFRDKCNRISGTKIFKDNLTRRAEDLFIPTESPLQRDDNENETIESSQEAKTMKRKNLFTRNKTRYGTVEYNDEIQFDNERRQKRLGEIQTKVDSWTDDDTRCNKTTLRDYEAIPKPPRYGSVEHNNRIQRDNAIRKHKIACAKTKVDTWQAGDTDDSHLHLNMKQYKPVQNSTPYSSVEHNNQIIDDNARCMKKLEGINTTLDTWKTKETDNSFLHPNMKGYELARKLPEYGSVDHNNMIKRNNAMRKARLGKIHTNLDTWNGPNPGSKYSVKRKDEWEPVIDPGKYGSVAHFNQIKNDNAMRKNRLSKVQSNLDSWNTQSPGSRYSLQRKDEWEPVYDIRKYGSVAHYHQVKQTHTDNKRRLNKATTKLSTWQPKSKMELLNRPHQRVTETNNSNMKTLNTSSSCARQGIDTGICDSDSGEKAFGALGSNFDTGRNAFSARDGYSITRGNAFNSRRNKFDTSGNVFSARENNFDTERNGFGTKKGSLGSDFRNKRNTTNSFETERNSSGIGKDSIISGRDRLGDHNISLLSSRNVSRK